MVRVAVGLLASVLLAAPAAAIDREINEGQLQFLTEPLPQPPHYHSRHISITPSSLKTGWVSSKQCHHNLDQVRAMEIVFGAGRVRNLRVVRAEHIGKAWVEADSVQMTDVGENAVICLVSESRSLIYDPVLHTYTLKSGPYMRRFLDGYFPIRVSLAVDYPSALLSLQELSPTELKLSASTPPGHVRIDTVFEGRLTIELQFMAQGPDKPSDGIDPLLR